MAAKRKTVVNEFERYTPAAQAQHAAEARALREENGNAFPFDKEFAPDLGESFDALPVIDTVKAADIIPDALQPRPSPLPEPIRARFRRNDLDAFGAAREWLKLAEKNPIAAQVVRRYRSMGENMAANGQINPITGRWEQAVIRGKEKRVFRIETGEQRFWSAVLHHAAGKLPPDELSLRVSIVPAAVAPTEIATVRRQISENRKNMQLTEVLQAREIARLLLAAISEKTGQRFPVDDVDEYEYFRAALRLGRVPRGIWEGVQAEFNLTQHRMRQSLEVLRFPSHLLDLAHHTRLSYRTLSSILKGPEESWELQVRQSALQAMEDEDEEEGGQPAQPGSAPAGGAQKRPKQAVDPAELAYRGVRRFYRSAIKGSRGNPLLIQSVADNVIMDGYAEEVVDFMDDLIRAIRQRLEEEQEV